MALAAGANPGCRATRGKRGRDIWPSHAGAVEGTRSEKSEGRGPRKPDSEESRSLAEDVFDGSRNPACERTRLAEHVHAVEKPGGVADHQARRGTPGCGCASGYR